jgi:hypothetical protein
MRVGDEGDSLGVWKRIGLNTCTKFFDLGPAPFVLRHCQLVSFILIVDPNLLRAFYDFVWKIVFVTTKDGSGYALM